MSIYLKPATVADAARLYSWRTDRGTATASRAEPPQSFVKDHLAWLAATLKKPSVHLLVAVDTERGVMVGTARLDVSGKRAEVSLTVDPQQRGRGYSGLVLQEAVLRARAIQLAALTAEVRQDNHASLRLFWQAEFRPAKKQPAGGEVVALELEL